MGSAKKVIIGVDESGTGAWAGPYTICAVAFYAHDEPYLKELGVRDSKKLTDRERRRLVSGIVGVALVGSIYIVDVEELDQLRKGAWVKGVVTSVKKVLELLKGRVTLQNVKIIIDGLKDQEVLRQISAPVQFMKRADATVMSVGAASILAKTHRNDLMTELHGAYPEYNWKQNAGYGSTEHQQALKKLGKTEHHRDIKPLEAIKERASWQRKRLAKTK